MKQAATFVIQYLTSCFPGTFCEKSWKQILEIFTLCIHDLSNLKLYLQNSGFLRLLSQIRIQTVVQFHNQDPRYFLQHQIYLCYLTLWYNCKIQNIWPKLREQNKKKENLKYCYYSNLQRKLDYPLKDQIDGYFIWLMHFSWNEPSKNWLLDQQLTFICQ